MSATETRLAGLGLRLPEPPAPAGNYRRTVIAGGLLFTSGHGPKPDPERQFIGKVGADIDDETARRAAHIRLSRPVTCRGRGVNLECSAAAP
jgi:enamine deaminase RidA (YjgF/YER057c/UK114 family)